jgi:uncharacterized protein with PQ loop repeat
MIGYSEIGIFGSVLLAIAFIPQCYRLLNTKRANDISTYYLFILIVGALCLTIYGYGNNDLIIFTLNLYAFFCNIELLGLKIYYDKISTKTIT